jgi:mono/diheme cytochrome c family protein
MSVKLEHEPVVPAPRRLGAGKKAILVATPVALAALAWGGAYLHLVSVRAAEARRTAAAAAHPAAPDGATLYTQHCAACHGARGDGVGATSPYLETPARRFGEERFRLASTANGVPTDDDLVAVVRNGIPGTAMPSFAHLSDGERKALAGHVLGLTRERLFAKVFRKAEEEGGADPAEVAEAVENMLRPGAPVEVPRPFAAATPESITHGRQLYTQNCASCHGPEGRGDGPQVKDLRNENGLPTRPRDLTRGVFKGGSDPARLYARIALGMPGTPMPASATLRPEEIADVINYIRSLSRQEPVTLSGTD